MFIEYAPFGVNLYLEQPQLPADRPSGEIFDYILPTRLLSLSVPVNMCQ